MMKNNKDIAAICKLTAWSSEQEKLIKIAIADNHLEAIACIATQITKKNHNLRIAQLDIITNNRVPNSLRAGAIDGYLVNLDINTPNKFISKDEICTKMMKAATTEDIDISIKILKRLSDYRACPKIGQKITSLFEGNILTLMARYPASNEVHKIISRSVSRDFITRHLERLPTTLQCHLVKRCTQNKIAKIIADPQRLPVEVVLVAYERLAKKTYIKEKIA